MSKKVTMPSRMAILPRLICIFSLVILLGWPVPLLHAQGGCPTHPNTSISLEQEEYEIYPLITALPEAHLSLAQGVFMEQTVELTYQVGQRVWLASYIDDSHLGDICTDDVLEVAVWPSGQTWQHDFRSSDRQQILLRQAVDITHLFVPGVNTVTLTLTDLTPPALSTSGYALVVASTILAPTETPIPPTATPEPVATATEVMTNTVQVDLPSLGDSAGPVIAVETETMVDSSISPATQPFQRWVWLLGLAALTLGLLIWRVRSRAPLPPGQVTLYDGMRYIKTVDLANLRKAVVTLGGAGAAIALPTESGPVPKVVACISAQSMNGKVQAVWEVLDPDDPTIIVERQTLQHGDSIPIFKQFRMEYNHYEVETSSFLEGEFINV